LVYGYREDEEKTLDKFCSACKYKNDGEALVCAYCGAPLESKRVDRTTEKMQGLTVSLPNTQGQLDTIRASSTIPPRGIAIYSLGKTIPIAIVEEKEFILGRHIIGEVDNIIDLTLYNGLEMGVSRQHALIRKAKDGFEIVDLNSTNGTWVNEKRLVPNQSYPLVSGVQIRLGRMLLLALFVEITGA
jgi:hypothetical protein